MADKKPNILVIWGDDIGVTNLSCYSDGLINLRTDPFERADVTSNTYYDWFLYRDHIIFAAQAIVASFRETFKAFPRRQKAASFTIDQAMAKMADAASGAGR